MKASKKVLLTSASAALLCMSQVQAGEWQGEASDAWIDGRLETSYLLNTELNNFSIDTDVENGVVMLSGSVESDAQRKLAEEIAGNVDGVNSVDNALELSPEAAMADRGGADRDFSTVFFDLTTTARIKSEYALNSELEATEINIDTMAGEVRLEGEVESPAQKQLAEEIASGIDHVNEVDNRLRVARS